MQLKHIKLHGLCFAIVLSSTLFIACDKDEDNEPDNEQELITTVSLSFLNTTTTTPITFTAKDLDGSGGNPPTIQPITLKANANYILRVIFLDESKNPVNDITTEVKKESNAHLLCFTPSGAMPALVIEDQDFNKKPLGLVSAFKTGAAGTGTLKITLKHEPDKDASNACSTGETDVEQTFNVTISN